MFTPVSERHFASQKVAPALSLAKIAKTGARAAFRRYKCAAKVRALGARANGRALEIKAKL
jgi:hypothetical protein